MEEEYRHHRIAIYATKAHGLALGKMDETQDEGEEQQQHRRRTEESLLLAHGAEDKVGVLFGHKLQFGLSAVEKSLAFKTARPYCYLTLMYIISRTGKILVETEKHIDSHPLVRLHDIVEHIICRIEKHHRPYGKEQDIIIVFYSRPQSVPQQP